MAQNSYNLLRFLCIILLLHLLFTNADAQGVVGKSFKDKNHEYYDSLKTMNYDRLFPIWGSRVYKKGYDLPLPFGIMVNSFYGIQGIDMSNMHLGINTSDTSLGPVDMSNIIKFSEVNSRIYNVNLRADLFVFPFLNVYALLGVAPYVQTSVVLSEPIALTSEPKQKGWFYGFGLMGVTSAGPLWFSADYNATWSDMQLLESKVFTQLLGLRVGHVFRLKNPRSNISVWAGTMGIFLNSGTQGQIALNDVFDGIDQSKVDAIKDSYQDWYSELNPLQKQVVDKIVEKLEDKVAGDPLRDVTITYSMDKTPSAKFAGLMGMQYQINKSWQLRAESNFISGGNRYSVLVSLNYRFLGVKKKSDS